MQGSVEPDMAERLPALVQGLNPKDGLAYQDCALDHPIERPALHEFFCPLGRLAGMNDRQALAAMLLIPPNAQVINAGCANAEFDQM